MPLPYRPSARAVPTGLSHRGPYSTNVEYLAIRAWFVHLTPLSLDLHPFCHVDYREMSFRHCRLSNWDMMREEK